MFYNNTTHSNCILQIGRILSKCILYHSIPVKPVSHPHWLRGFAVSSRCARLRRHQPLNLRPAQTRVYEENQFAQAPQSTILSDSMPDAAPYACARMFRSPYAPACVCLCVQRRAWQHRLAIRVQWHVRILFVVAGTELRASWERGIYVCMCLIHRVHVSVRSCWARMRRIRRTRECVCVCVCNERLVLHVMQISSHVDAAERPKGS